MHGGSSLQGRGRPSRRQFGARCRSGRWPPMAGWLPAAGRRRWLWRPFLPAYGWRAPRRPADRRTGCRSPVPPIGASPLHRTAPRPSRWRLQRWCFPSGWRRSPQWGARAPIAFPKVHGTSLWRSGCLPAWPSRFPTAAGGAGGGCAPDRWLGADRDPIPSARLRASGAGFSAAVPDPAGAGRWAWFRESSPVCRPR